MQGTEGQNEVPIAELGSIPRQPATECHHNDDWASKSISLESDTSKVIDPQVHLYGQDWERDREPQSMPPQQHIQERKIEATHRYSLAYIVDVNERRYNHFAEAQLASVAQRLEVHHQLDNFQHILGRLQNTVGALTTGVTDGKTENASKRSKARLKRLKGRLHTDAEELTRHIQSTMMLISQLREIDRTVEEVGDALHNSFQAISTSLRWTDNDDRLHESVSLVPTPTYGSGESDASKTSVAVELANFYDAVGDFKIMRERIGELHLEKQEQEERRELLGDQELKPERRNVKFLRAWHQTLAKAERDCQEAEAAVERARKACEEVNVSIPLWAESEADQRYAIAAQFDDIFNPLESTPVIESVVGSSTNSSEPVMVDVSSPMFNSLTSQPLSEGKKITRWMESVPLDATILSPETTPSMPIRNDMPSVTSPLDPENRSFERLRGVRSLSLPPSGTRHEITLRSSVSCPSLSDTARGSRQALEKILTQVTPSTAIHMPSCPMQ